MDMTKKTIAIDEGITDVMHLVRESELPNKPGDIDLRFFRAISFADTCDGVGVPWDGVEYSAILYGNKVVYQTATWRQETWKHPQSFEGNSELYRRMFDVARTYLKILKIGRIKYHGGKPLEGDDRWDQILLLPEDKVVLRLLRKHPQYQHLVKAFGLTLDKVDNIHYRVSCSKSLKANTD